MNKEELELCREVLKIFDKGTFTQSGPELVQMAMKFMSFAKMIQRKEAELIAPIVQTESVIAPIEDKPILKRKR